MSSTISPSDKTALETIVKAFNDGLVAADRALLESLMDDHLSYGHSGGNTETKAETIDAFVSGKYKFGKIEVSEQHLQLFGDTGVVRQKFYATTADQGKASGEVHLFILTVWKKTEGAWKLITRQAVKNLALMK